MWVGISLKKNMNISDALNPAFASGNLLYKIEEKNTKFLLPTAETALVNIHSNEIMDVTELPKKYFAYTQCFRVEAGSSREKERGTIATLLLTPTKRKDIAIGKILALFLTSSFCGLSNLLLIYIPLF